MEPWVWPVLLLALGLGLAVLEVFFPSAGLLAFFSASSLVAAVMLGFRHGTGTGLAVLAAVVVGAPATVVLAFRWWPYTYVGRQVLLEAPTATEVLPDDPDRRFLKNLVGRVGRTKCMMLPGGIVTVDGHTVEAVSEGMAIEAEQPVRIIKVEANRVVVRPTGEEAPVETSHDPLDRPIDSISADPFADRVK